MSLSDKLEQKQQQKKEKPKKTTTKTTTSVKRPSKYELLEDKFNSFKIEIDQKLQQILQQKLQSETNILPEEIRTELITLLQADYIRFIKYGYGNYQGYVEDIATFFNITLTKPKKKKKKEDKGK